MKYLLALFPSLVMAAYMPAATQGGSVTYTQIASCQWSTSSASFTNLGDDTDCNTPVATGNVSVPATKLPGLLVAAIPIGSYLVQATGGFLATASTSGANVCAFRFSDGTVDSPHAGVLVGTVSTGARSSTVISAVMTFASAATSRTIQIQAALLGGNGNCRIETDASGRDLTISFFKLN